MTRDEITRMAREAGFVGFDGENKSLRQFATLVAAAEREACAKVCDFYAEKLGGDNIVKKALKATAFEIRARRQK